MQTGFHRVLRNSNVRIQSITAVLSALSIVHIASATTRDWVGGSSDWSAAANWNPSGVPASGDTVNVTDTTGSAQTVTYDYTDVAVTLDKLSVDLTNFVSPASSTILMSANDLTSNSEYIGNSGGGSNGTGNFSQSGGTNTISANGGLFLGYNASDYGDYDLTDSGALVSNGKEVVGYSGTGILNQGGGTNTINPNFNLFIGDNSTASGTYILSDTGALTVNNTENVGYFGTGMFNQSGGTNTINSGGTLIIANEAGSNGMYTATGTASLIVNGAERIANYGTGEFDQTSGQNTVESGFNFFVGFQGGSNGTYTLGGDGKLTVTGSEYVGNDGTGIFKQNGGTNLINATLEIGYEVGSTGTYNLSAGTVTVTGSWEDVGVSGNGTFNQSGGENTIENTDLSIGYGAGSSGTYNLSAGTLTASGSFEAVGYSGNGTFNQTGGINNVNTAYGLDIGDKEGSTGQYNLSGGSLIVPAGVFVSGTGLGPGGNGTLTVSSSGQLNVTKDLVVYAQGRVNICNGTTTVGGLTISPGGIVNVNDLLTVNYGSGDSSPMSTILTYLESGYDRGKWDGTGINSSLAANDPSRATTLGYSDNGTNLTIMYTWVGDVDLNGIINTADLLAMVPGATNATWSEGDFNYDGVVNADDYSLFMLGLATSDGANISATLPEPSPLPLILLTAGSMLMFRRRGIQPGRS